MCNRILSFLDLTFHDSKDNLAWVELLLGLNLKFEEFMFRVHSWKPAAAAALKADNVIYIHDWCQRCILYLTAKQSTCGYRA